MRHSILLSFIFIFIFMFSVKAVEPAEVFSDEKLEKRARILFRELRCVVCQNQSIEDSEAVIAKDLRFFIRERILQGQGDKEIRHEVVERFGEFVLLKPDINSKTIILWLFPFFILLLGVFIFIRFIVWKK